MMSCNRRDICAGLGLTALNTMLSNGNAHGGIMIPGVAPSKLTYEPLTETGPAGTAVNAIAWSPDGELLATTTRGGTLVQLWDVKAKKNIWELQKGIADQSLSLVFTLDGKHLIISSALAGAERHGVVLSLVDVETGRVTKNIGRPEGMEEAGVARNWVLNATGTRLAVSFFTVEPIPFPVYDTADWHAAAVIDSRARRFVFDPVSGVLAANAPASWIGEKNTSSRRLDYSTAGIEIWDVDANRLLKKMPSYGRIHTYVPQSHVMVLTSLDPQRPPLQQITDISLLDSISETKNTIMQFMGTAGLVAVNRDGFVFSALVTGSDMAVWRMSEDKSEVTWSRRLELTGAGFSAPVFNPKADLMAFAIENRLCLAQT
jgi:WD40 repeat protein